MNLVVLLKLCVLNYAFWEEELSLECIGLLIDKKMVCHHGQHLQKQVDPRCLCKVSMGVPPNSLSWDVGLMQGRF